jgi:23S rRNA pseudouridine1911/1915/1917 synthase
MENHQLIASFAPELSSEERIDRYLGENLEHISRSRIQKLIELGQVTINDRVCENKKELIKNGDRLTISIPEITALDLEPQAMSLEILFEDQDLLVINKPVGLVVHPAPGHQDHTLVNALLAHCDHLSGINGIARPGIVHRLDKDTSGAIVVAKTDAAHQSLQAQIQAKTAKREYLGIVQGIPKLSQGTVNAAIGRHHSDRQKMAVIENGRAAITHWQVLARGNNYALVKFDLETGRTHQIRVHSAYIGHAIAADPVYAHKIKGIEGQLLHAWRLSFCHPTTQVRICAIAPPPLKFMQFLKRFFQLDSIPEFP